jgi:hypothetical protein
MKRVVDVIINLCFVTLEVVISGAVLTKGGAARRWLKTDLSIDVCSITVTAKKNRIYILVKVSLTITLLCEVTRTPRRHQ